MIRFVLLLFGGLFSYGFAMGQCDGQPPGATAVGGVLTCANQSIQLQGSSPTAGVVYSWFGPNGFFSEEQNPVIFEIGTYFLEVKNPVNDCSSVAYVIIVQNYFEPGATGTGSTISCSGSAVQLSGYSPTPGVEYTWSSSEGFSSNLQNPVVTAPGNYYLNVTNPVNGCESIDIVLVEIVEGACFLQPVAINDVNITLKGIEVAGNVLTNDHDPDGFGLYVEGFRLASESGPFSETVALQGQGELTLVDPVGGAYMFVPDPGFAGSLHPIEYQVCDSEDGQCATATLVIKIIDGEAYNFPPVAVDDHFQTSLGATVIGSVLFNDFDTDADPVILTPGGASGNSSHGGSWSMNMDNTFYYTPPVGFTGLDSLFIYQICDGISGCDQAAVTVLVMEPGGENSMAPFATDDARVTRHKFPVSGNLMENDVPDAEGGIMTVLTANGGEVAEGGSTISTINGNLITIFQDGSFNYEPAHEFFGPDRLAYKVCNSSGHCDFATAYFIVMPPHCITVDLWVYLEGAFLEDQSGMSTNLNTGRSLLPGQIPLNSSSAATPAGNPYRGAPWNYSGTPEEENYQGPYVDAFGQAVTDWVLVTFRSGPDAQHLVTKANGLLYEDGRIEFIDPCVLRSSDPSDLWIIIEHRNHMGVMSDTMLEVVAGKLNYDFRYGNSFSSPTSFGQTPLAPGVWGMFAGDTDQAEGPGYDINGTDHIPWTQYNGSFDVYHGSDIDLNCDVNGADNILFNANNGISSQVPKE